MIDKLFKLLIFLKAEKKVLKMIRYNRRFYYHHIGIEIALYDEKSKNPYLGYCIWLHWYEGRKTKCQSYEYNSYKDAMIDFFMMKNIIAKGVKHD